MASEEKKFQAFLNGLVRKVYYGDNEITNELLKNEIYPDVSQADFSHLVDKHLGLIKSIASASMDFNQLDAFLTSQTKKKEGAITEEHSKVYKKFWKNHKNKVHEIMVSQSSWNNRIKNIGWRVDIKSQGRNVDQIQVPTAIVELKLTNTNNKDGDVVTFEMDENKLNSVLSSFQEIESKLNSYCSQE